MNRNEFLKKLKENLDLSLEKDEISKHLDYYDKYISDEINKGRTEKEILDELGDPMLIAKTIKTVEGSATIVDEQSSGDNSDTHSGSNRSKGNGNNAGSGPFVYVGNTGVIGCAIIFLVVFIIIMSLLKLLGYVAIGATGMMFGMGPFSIIILLLLFYFMFGNRR